MNIAQKIILKPVNVRNRGRFRAVVHTGHTYDAFGNIVRHGLILRETPFGNNKITLTGLGKLLQNSFSTMVMVAGSGNTSPSENDSSLASYLGKTGTVASQATTRNVIPDGNNEVWWRTTFRMTFGPGSMGGGSVNVAEAGITTGTVLNNVNASTPVSARGLLVDENNNPTTVSVDNAVEYLDVIWEYTEWVSASTVGTVDLTIDGVVTPFDYEVRPTQFDNVGGSFNFGGWQNAGSLTIPGYALNVSTSGYPWSQGTRAFEAMPGAITGNAMGNGVSGDTPIGSTPAHIVGTKYRTMRLTWLPLQANFASGIGTVRVNLGHANWQVGFTPKIPKDNKKQLDLYFTYSMDNR